MSRAARRGLQIAVSLALSSLFLYLALRGEDWGAIRTELAHTRYEYLLAMAVVGTYVMYARCQRWRILLEAATGRRPEIGPLFSATAIGFMANMLLPLRVGEFARPYIVSRRTTIPLSTALATTVLERVLDLLALFGFGLWVVNNADVPDIVRNFTWIAGGGAGVLIVGVSILSTHREALLPKVDRIWDLFPMEIAGRIRLLEHEFLDGVTTIANLRVFTRVAVWSFYIWFVIACSFALGFYATSISVPFLAGGVTVTTIVALAVSVPGAPGFVGQFEWGCKIALQQVFGIDGARAVGFSIATHITQFV
ncbi:MAG: flippase-like domain-containing protein, partial [Myxococcales bacterium]